MKTGLDKYHDTLKDFFHPTWKKMFIVFIFSILFVLVLFSLGYVNNWLLSSLLTSTFIILNPFWLLLINNTSATPYPILSAIYNLILLVIFPIYWYVIASLIDKALDGNRSEDSRKISSSEGDEEEYVKLGSSSNYENY